MKIQLLTTLALLTGLTTPVHAEGDAAAGQAKSAMCIACHGETGVSPNPEWPNLAGQNAGYIARQLAAFKDGTERNNAVMAGMVAALSEEDMANLAAFYAAQSPGGNTANAELATLGAQVYRAGNPESGVPACMGCHGPAGAGDPAASIPMLAGQHAKYTEIQLEAFKAGARQNDPNGMMRGVVKWLTPAELKAVASYIAGLH